MICSLLRNQTTFPGGTYREREPVEREPRLPRESTRLFDLSPVVQTHSLRRNVILYHITPPLKISSVRNSQTGEGLTRIEVIEVGGGSEEGVVREEDVGGSRHVFSTTLHFLLSTFASILFCILLFSMYVTPCPISVSVFDLIFSLTIFLTNF